MVVFTMKFDVMFSPLSQPCPTFYPVVFMKTSSSRMTRVSPNWNPFVLPHSHLSLLPYTPNEDRVVPSFQCGAKHSILDCVCGATLTFRLSCCLLPPLCLFSRIKGKKKKHWLQSASHVWVLYCLLLLCVFSVTVKVWFQTQQSGSSCV